MDHSVLVPTASYHSTCAGNAPRDILTQTCEHRPKAGDTRADIVGRHFGDRHCWPTRRPDSRQLRNIHFYVVIDASLWIIVCYNENFSLQMQEIIVVNNYMLIRRNVSSKKVHVGPGLDCPASNTWLFNDSRPGAGKQDCADRV